jgi:hypothetical protein
MMPGTGLIIDGVATSLADVRNWVLSGFGSGTGGGQGISLAEDESGWRIGYAVGGAVSATTDRFSMSNATFTGSGQAIEERDLFVRAVQSGDTDLDGAVGFDDLRALAQNYGLTGKLWSDGELTYSSDGAVDFDDLLQLAQNYQPGSSADPGTTPGALALYLELAAGAPWILEDALSQPDGQALFGAYVSGDTGLGSGYVTHLQNYSLENNLAPEPSSLAGFLLVRLVRRRR